MSTENGKVRAKWSKPEDDDALKAQVDAIYRQIIARAPEHDFEPSLDRIRDICTLMGDPQRDFKVVHVAGTNGKTSTSRMIETLVREHGLRTGLFTSPHLADVRERIQLDGEPISRAKFVATWAEVEPYIDLVDARSAAAGGPAMSFFEVLTAMAFAAFADSPVDVAVIEVGMGGSWDATNVVDSQVQVITPISKDHQQWLGDDLADIAGEKAGIIGSDGIGVVVGEQVEVAAGVVADRIAELGAHAAWAGIDVDVATRVPGIGGQLLTLRGIGGVYPEVFVPLLGAHQAGNALLALCAVELLLGEGERLDPDVVRSGFAQVTSPGRLEVVRISPTIVVDAGHNPAGIDALVEAVRESFVLERLVGVFAVMADKDPETMLGELEPLLDEIVITECLSSRALPAVELAEIAIDVFGEDRVHLEVNLPNALTRATDLAEAGGVRESAVLATGSVVLAGEVRTLLGR